VSVAPVVSVGASVVTVAGLTGVDADSRFGRRNHTRVAVTTKITTPTAIAVYSSRRGRGALYGTRFPELALALDLDRIGLIA
jgi:hypothetical protein